MQINTVNGLIAIFLIGGLVIVMAAVAVEEQVQPYLPQYSGVFLAVALLSAAALAGVIVEAVGNLTVGRFQTWAAKRRSRARLFFGGARFDEQERWRNVFRASVQNDVRYKHLAQDDMIEAAAAGRHHSMDNLAANFAVVLIACAIWALWSGEYWLALAAIAGSYLLMTRALEHHLAAYQLAFRDAYLALNEARTGALASNIETTHHYMFAVWRPAWTGVVHLPSCGRFRRRTAQLR